MTISGKVVGLNPADTIAAIATAPGPSGISVIRISGNKSREIADKIFFSKIKPSKASAQTIHYGKIIDPMSEKLLDEVLLAVFATPNSYTGEDMIEISCHGGNFAASAILKLINKFGARLAEPGEFTKRRVLAGKMDITQAEAVLDLIRAKNESTYLAAIRQLQGSLSAHIQNASDELKSIVAQMENLLEFEEDHKQTESEYKKIASKLKLLYTNLKDIVSRNEASKFLREGVYVAIIGRPNVGKSSLFNRFCETEKAIVTEIPGTTRDSLEQTIVINDIVVNLIDTAGMKIINQTKGSKKIEALGIEKSKNWLATADFILAMFDNSRPIDNEDRLVYNAIKDKPHLCVLNKIDLKSNFNRQFFNGKKPFLISAKYNKGINRLKTKIINFYKKRLPDNYLYLNTRHLDTLNRVLQLLKQNEQEKILEVSIMNLRNALEILGSVTSVVTNEQILDTIFSQFCIGK